VQLQDESLQSRNNEHTEHSQHIGSRLEVKMARYPCGTYTEKIQIDLSCKEAMGIFSGLAKW
jgi:hypothetical protein